ncbi:MAG TPA: inorganic diphosphatase [Candidatus Paceibacterota bacterium]|nr:inorganic diphosphatase [Candidatus Paceibacterota bacterium]
MSSSFDKIKLGGKSPKIINAVIEIPKGTHNKYEYDEELDVFKLDRVLHSPLHYPADYGFIPQTRAEDGDHLDILVIGGGPTFTSCVVRARPVGMMEMFDEGERDLKIFSVQVDNTRMENVKNLKDLQSYNPHFLEEAAHFFEAYKHLEGKEVEIKKWGDKEKAYEEIEKAIERYKKEN